MASQQDQKNRTPQNGPQPVEMEGATGASDGYSGAGAGSGNPSADLDARAGDVVERGDTEKDRKKLFPESE